jgi:chemotaxis methyl-accepting protein methylase
VVRYFDHAGENWTVKPAIRKMCNFRAGQPVLIAAALQPQR